MHLRQTPFLPALLWPVIAALTLWVMWPGLSGPFIFDDFPNLQHLGNLGGRITWGRLGYYLAGFSGDPGRPLAALSFLINDNAWPSQAAGFKYTNLMLHVLAGLVAFGFARSLALSSRDRPIIAAWVALCTSAIVMLHPIQVSALLLVVQRMTILSALFVMCGLWAYVALLRRAQTTLQVFFALATLAVFTVLAFLCKENGALAPLYAWTLHATILRERVEALPRRGGALARWSIRGAAVAPMLGALANVDSLDFSRRSFDLTDRLLTQPRVLADYLGSIFLPRISGGGSIFHDDFAASTGLLTPTSTLAAIALLLAALAAGLALRKKRPWIALGVLWYLAGHSIESSFVALELYFEHRNYLPLFGIAIALSHTALTASGKVRAPAIAAITIWLGLAGFVTAQQTKVWGSERLMAETWGSEHPGSNRATQLRAKVRYEARDFDGARQIFVDALRAGQGANNAELYLITIDCEHGRRISPEQFAAAKRRLSSRVPDTGSSELMAQLQRRASRGNCPGFGMREWFILSDTLIGNPRNPWPAISYYHRALARLSQRDAKGLKQELNAAYRVRPEQHTAYVITSTLLQAGLYDDALVWARKHQELKGSPFKDWLRQHKANSAELVDSIAKARAERVKRQKANIPASPMPASAAGTSAN